MLNTTPPDTAETRLGTDYVVEQHLHRHGAGSCDLLDALDNPSGFVALCDLYGAFGQPIRNAYTVEGALQAIQCLLADQAPSPLDWISHQRGLPVSDMAWWHDVRVSELLARFLHGR